MKNEKLILVLNVLKIYIKIIQKVNNLKFTMIYKQVGYIESFYNKFNAVLKFVFSELKNKNKICYTALVEQYCLYKLYNNNKKK